MYFSVGFSENPDTEMAGVEAVSHAVLQSGRKEPCDLVLLFSTARHDARVLHEAVISAAGGSAKVIGGGAVGMITNTHFGYAGDQIGLALIWLEGVRYDVLVKEGLVQGNEHKVGELLGNELMALGKDCDSSVMMFYDSFDRTQPDLRLILATPMLAGIERGMGCLPKLTGAGLMGDFTHSPSWQWAGDDIVERHALALVFSDEVRIDSIIMHGCRPITSYYTVTKADNQTILEINGEPALLFINKLLGNVIPPENYPFFLIFGINKGDKWGEFNDLDYVNRLCLAIDKKRNGLIMFEPDMVEGTQFQLMHRSFDFDYMKPKIESVFHALNNRKPVFAFYIVCAGRAAAYAGLDQEDAIVVQEAVANRVPLLGVYTGVEIGLVSGRPRALDWTGVFCVFSVPE